MDAYIGPMIYFGVGKVMGKYVWRWGRLAFVEEQRSKAVLLGLVAFVGMFGYEAYGKTLVIVNFSTDEFPQLPKATG